jgi:hypothetical protein
MLCASCVAGALTFSAASKPRFISTANNSGKNDNKSKSEMRGFFAALRMTTSFYDKLFLRRE